MYQFNEPFITETFHRWCFHHDEVLLFLMQELLYYINNKERKIQCKTDLETGNLDEILIMNLHPNPCPECDFCQQIQLRSCRQRKASI